MGRLPDSAVEARLAATLFLLLLGMADVFGAWQVRQFAAFTPPASPLRWALGPTNTGWTCPSIPNL